MRLLERIFAKRSMLLSALALAFMILVSAWQAAESPWRRARSWVLLLFRLFDACLATSTAAFWSSSAASSSASAFQN